MADFQFYLNTQGLRGRTGAKGADGFAPIIAVGQNTLNTFTLLITTVDGTFETPNLRGSIINNAGAGTFLRYDAESDSIYLSELPTASETEVGGVTIATDEELTNAAGTGVVTADSMGVGIYGALKAGENVNLSLDNETGLVTISSIDTKYTLPVATTDILGGVKPDGTTIAVTEDGTISAVGGGQGGTSDYNELSNKPQINGIELNGNSSLDLLDIQGKITTEKPLNITVKETGFLKGLTRLSDGTYQMNKDGYSVSYNTNPASGGIDGLNTSIEPSSGSAYRLYDGAFPNYIDIPITCNSIISIPPSIYMNRVIFGYIDDDGAFVPTAMPFTSNVPASGLYPQILQARGNYSARKSTSFPTSRFDISNCAAWRDYSNTYVNSRATRKYLQYIKTNNIQLKILSNDLVDATHYGKSVYPNPDTSGYFSEEAAKTNICRIIGLGGSTINISDIKLFDGTDIDILSTPEEQLLALPNLYNPERSIITRTLSVNTDNQTVVTDSNGNLSVGDDVLLKEQLYSQLVQGNNITITENADTHKVTISSTGLDSYTKDETNELLALKADISSLDDKQDKLISGTNIKTINGNSILGEGNIDISGGASGASIDDSTTSTASTWSSSKINTELTTRDTTITEAQNEITLIQGDVAALDADVSTLKTTTEEHATSISSLNTLLTQLTDRIAALEAEINGGNA